MKAQFKALVTTGVAVVGTAVIAAPSIVAAPPADVSVRADAAQNVSLTANAVALPDFDALQSGDFLERLGQSLENTINSALGQESPWRAPRTPVPADDVVDGFLQITEGLGASGLRLLASGVLGPLGLLQLADGVDGLEEFIVNTVDAPLWIADPLLYGLMNAVVADFGGGPGGTLFQFRNNLHFINNAVNDLLLDLIPTGPDVTPLPSPGPDLGDIDVVGRLGQVLENTLGSALGTPPEYDAPRPYQPTTDPLDAALTIGEGLAATALRLVAGVVLSPGQLLNLADGSAGLETLISNLVGAPLWAADPALYALGNALPELLGGGANGTVRTLRLNLYHVTSRVDDLIQDLLPTDSILASGSSVNDTQQVAAVPEVAAQTVNTTVVDDAPVTQPTRAANTLRTKAPAVADDIKRSAPKLTVESQSKSSAGALDTSVEINDAIDSKPKRGSIREPAVQATPGQATKSPTATPTNEPDGSVSLTETDDSPSDAGGEKATSDDDK